MWNWKNFSAKQNKKLSKQQGGFSYPHDNGACHCPVRGFFNP